MPLQTDASNSKLRSRWGKRRVGVALTAPLSLVAMLAAGTTPPAQAAFPGTYGQTGYANRTALDAIEDELAAIVAANPGTKQADKMEDVRAKVHSAREKHRNDDMQGAAGEIEGAVGDLEAALKDRLIRDAVARPLLTRLARASRVMARQAIDAAMARGGSVTKIAEARDVLRKGDQALGARKFKLACAEYKDAVAKAQGA